MNIWVDSAINLKKYIKESFDIKKLLFELEDYEGICHSYQEEVKAFHKIVPLEKKWSMSVLTKLMVQ